MPTNLLALSKIQQAVLIEALDQFVANTEEIAEEGGPMAQLLESAEAMLETLNGARSSLAEGA